MARRATIPTTQRIASITAVEPETIVSRPEAVPNAAAVVVEIEPAKVKKESFTNIILANNWGDSEYLYKLTGGEPISVIKSDAKAKKYCFKKNLSEFVGLNLQDYVDPYASIGYKYEPITTLLLDVFVKKLKKLGFIWDWDSNTPKIIPEDTDVKVLKKLMVICDKLVFYEITKVPVL